LDFPIVTFGIVIDCAAGFVVVGGVVMVVVVSVALAPPLAIVRGARVVDSAIEAVFSVSLRVISWGVSSGDDDDNDNDHVPLRRGGTRPNSFFNNFVVLTIEGLS